MNVSMNYKFFSLFLIFVFPIVALAQKITYSEPESQDTRALEFEIIGKTAGNFLVYKNIRNQKAISVYDTDMKLVDRVNLDFLPDRVVNVDFVSYPDYSYMIYQFQRRNIIHCMAAKFDGNAKMIGEPIELDTAYISVFADNRIYSTIHSDDRQQIMIYKVQKKNDKFHFTTLLFDPQLRIKKKSRLSFPYEDRRDLFSDFFVDNLGNFVFTRSVKSGARDLINKLHLMVKQHDQDTFSIYEINMGGHYLDEVKLKVDNINKRYVLNSLFYKTRRGNVEGLFTAVWDANTKSQIFNAAAAFSDSLKQRAKSGGSSKYAFNDFFIRNIILRKDGGFILTAEDFYTQSRVTPWNRLDYLYRSPYMSSYDYYLSSPSSYYYYRRPGTSFNTFGQVRYYYENVAVMSFDRSGKLEWHNVIQKNQYDDETDAYLSYQLVNAGGELHFLFNELERRNQLMADHSITPSGKLVRNPTLKSMDRGYQFKPRYGKQVSSKQIIMPCSYRNYICFAKIEYN
jgi:hypothetical protein